MKHLWNTEEKELVNDSTAEKRCNLGGSTDLCKQESANQSMGKGTPPPEIFCT